MLTLARVQPRAAGGERRVRSFLDRDAVLADADERAVRLQQRARDALLLLDAAPVVVLREARVVRRRVLREVVGHGRPGDGVPLERFATRDVVGVAAPVALRAQHPDLVPVVHQGREGLGHQDRGGGAGTPPVVPRHAHEPVHVVVAQLGHERAIRARGVGGKDGQGAEDRRRNPRGALVVHGVADGKQHGLGQRTVERREELGAVATPVRLLGEGEERRVGRAHGVVPGRPEFAQVVPPAVGPVVVGNQHVVGAEPVDPVAGVAVVVRIEPMPAPGDLLVAHGAGVGGVAHVPVDEADGPAIPCGVG